MTAAQTARVHHDNVILFDKNPEPGKKLHSLPIGSLIIGEKMPADKAAKAFGDKEDFIRPAFKAFGWKELQEHLGKVGIKVTPNGNSHLRASSETSSDISASLKNAAEKAGVTIKKSSKVSDIIISDNTITGVIINGVKHDAAAVIIACGSFSSPKRGSTRDGYDFAKKAGHTVNPIKPAFVGMETMEKYGKLLNGAELSDCQIQVDLNGAPQFVERGQLKFTSYGLDGEVILTNSNRIIDLIQKGKVDVHIDLMPDKNKSQLEALLEQEASSNDRVTLSDLLKGFFPKEFLKSTEKIIRIHEDKPLKYLSHLEKKALALWLKDFPFTLRRARPFSETRGVLGGVSTDEIDPETMRSKKISNLYFAGEVLDLLGPWGGYNIQMAFSTGHLAGESA